MRAGKVYSATNAGVFCLAVALCAVLAWIILQPVSLQSQPEPGLERYALVVVAAHYRKLPSRPDYIPHARAMAGHAAEAGYALVGGGAIVNPTEYELRRAIDILGQLTENGAEALVYFAGHAIPGDNTIYLLATDIGPMPLVRYDVGGVRLESAWSHPLGSGPSKTTIIIETQGMGGLFSGGLPSFGTGMDTLEAPEYVTVAISDQNGPVTVPHDALHRIGPVRPPLLPSLWRPDTGQTVIFTPTLVELRVLDEPDLAAALARASLDVHERSSSHTSPVIVASLAANGLPHTRPELPAMGAEDIEAPDEPDEPGDASGPQTALAGAEAEPAPDEAGDPETALAEAAIPAEDAPTVTLMLQAAPPQASGGGRSGQSVIELIQMFEAFRAASYLDQAGIRTIGYGHTGPDAHAGQPITHDRALELLMADIDTAALAVEAAVTRDLTDNQRNALISLTFNIGAEAFRNSTLVRRINDDITSVSAAQFLRWVHARVPGTGMRALSGLESRRQMEAFLFLVEADGVGAIELILSFEPFRPHAARVNNCSMIGYGRALRPCEQTFDAQISQVEALQYLRRELGLIEREARALVTVPVSDAQMAALISFVHQNGAHTLAQSRILSRLNAGDYAGAANALRLHNAFVGGAAMQVGASHIERRAAEAALFFAHGGDYVIAPRGDST